jgi:DNA-binding NarL/FixJ family response regulator
MKLLIIDDHAIVREGLAAMLRQASVDTLVLQARDGADGLSMAALYPNLDAVFLDLSMPGMDGMAVLREFSKRHPQLPVIVLSSSEDPEDVRRALSLGALGYVPKSDQPQTLLLALQLVLAGNVYVPPLLLRQTAGRADHSYDRRASDSQTSLTQRQTEVLKCMCEGLSNKEIARALALSDKTVKAHITAIFKALGVVNRTQAALAAQQRALV